ncbi:MAG: 4Fe-4S binding protein [Clostridiales bacterium]|nr:4Fe-4S binding protein [Clostridiales bacterium]
MKLWLRRIRIVVQLAVFIMLTWAIVAAPVILDVDLLGLMEKWQLIPMAFLGCMSVVGFWLVVTLVFGRVYCSSVCPVGTLLDIAAVFPKLKSGKLIYRYRVGQPRVVRAAMLSILLLVMIFVSFGVAWTLMPFIQVSPCDSYDSIVSNIFVPLVDFLARDTVTPVSVRLIVTSAMNFIFIIAMGFMRGRDLCNVLCPVGSALGCVNSISLLHIDIDTDKCTHCRRCEYVCKSHCINSEVGAVDLSRCVVCFDCLSQCSDNAIDYTTRRHRLSTPLFQSLKSPKPALNIDSTHSYINLKIDETVS